jgi:hypothetical protein
LAGKRNLCRTIRFAINRYHQRHGDQNRRIRETRQRRSRGTPVSGKEVGESMVQSGCVRRAQAYNWGNSGRNILRGPDEINLDSSAEKKFPITEGATLLFRVEFFNMFNHPQFQIPATNTARQMQFTLRLSF